METSRPQHQVEDAFPLRALLAGSSVSSHQHSLVSPPQHGSTRDAQPGAGFDAVPTLNDPNFAPLLDEVLSWQ